MNISPISRGPDYFQAGINVDKFQNSENRIQKDQHIKKVAEQDTDGCETCKNRKYQDGSDDPGVSFKTASKIAPENVASAVRGHENEHVVRERAEAQREDKKVVYQSVRLKTDICPECGKAYISGGETTTVTKGQKAENAYNIGNPDGEARKGRFVDAKG